MRGEPWARNKIPGEVAGRQRPLGEISGNENLGWAKFQARWLLQVKVGCNIETLPTRGGFVLLFFLSHFFSITQFFVNFYSVFLTVLRILYFKFYSFSFIQKLAS